MEEKQISFYWKLTAQVKPKDGQTCVVFNPCDGYRIAEYSEEDECFFQDVPFEIISDHLAIYWMELPDTALLGRLDRGSACQLVLVSQAIAFSGVTYRRHAP